MPWRGGTGRVSPSEAGRRSAGTRGAPFRPPLAPLPSEAAFRRIRTKRPPPATASPGGAAFRRVRTRYPSSRDRMGSGRGFRPGSAGRSAGMGSVSRRFPWAAASGVAGFCRVRTIPRLCAAGRKRGLREARKASRNINLCGAGCPGASAVGGASVWTRGCPAHGRVSVAGPEQKWDRTPLGATDRRRRAAREQAFADAPRSGPASTRRGRSRGSEADGRPRGGTPSLPFRHHSGSEAQ